MRLFASKAEIEVNEEALKRRKQKQPSDKKTLRSCCGPFYCKGCGLCVDICPTGVLLLSNNKLSKWGISVIKIGCLLIVSAAGMCEQRCPDFAIMVDYEGEDEIHE